MKIDAIELFVEKIKGKGNLSFVLIHNAGGDHYFFSHQIEMLKNFGDIVWLDLPGHGTSQAALSYTMHELSSIIKKICQKAFLKNICLIGLNNGSNIAIDALLNQNLDVQKLILIDPPIFLDSAFSSEIQSYIQSLGKAQFNQEYVTSFVDSLFLDTGAPNKEIASSAFNKVDKSALAEIFKGILEWDANAKGMIRKISCPTLCILTDEHHCSFNKMKYEAPQVEIGKVIGSKCWATLEVPEQVNAMISRFLQISNM